MAFILLALAIVLALRGLTLPSLATVTLALIVATVQGELHWMALMSIAGLGASSFLSSHRSLPLWLRWLFLSFTLGLVLALSLHRIPGFDNRSIAHNLRLGVDSLPYSLHLNYDKTLAGYFLYLFQVKPFENAPLRWRQATLAIKAWLGVVVVMMTLSTLVHYVHFDPKWPMFSGVWMFNNLFFVCFSEEVLFRGVIQRTTRERLTKSKWGSPVAMAVAALLFGLAHIQGGLIYVALATIAGAFYGFTYERTRRLEWPVLVHFGLNVVHFFGFSYPALMG